MRRGKIIVVGILSAVMVFSSVIVSNAAEKERISDEQAVTLESLLNCQQITSLMEILSDVECQKDVIGLAEINFATLEIGTAIQTYNYVDNTFEEARKMYPITYNNELVLWIIDNGGQFQVTTALVNEVNSTIESNIPFSIVYDRNSSYLYANDNFILLGSSEIKDMTRAVLEPDSIMFKAGLKTTALTENVALGYEASTHSDLVCASAYAESAPIYYECSVGYVGQSPYNNLCWAASVASIANYCNGTSLSAASVAQECYGTSNFDLPIFSFDAPTILSNYNLEYSYREAIPSNNVIQENLMADYPIYSNFSTGTTGHATVIYAINTRGGYIYIMDPEFGFTSIGPSSYSYVSGLSGATLTLISASCHSW